MLKKIVAIGPESTGKSSLCEQLAEHYKTLWCPEYAREYLTKHGMDYTYDDLLTIAKEQIRLEDEYTQLAIGNKQIETEIPNASHSSLITHYPLLFIDTDMYVMKVWCEFVFGNCHQFILDEIAKRKYDLYLLCNIDLPWAYDVLREYPDAGPREKLYGIYKNILQNQSTSWIEISGDYEQRLQKAINAVDNLLKE